MAKIKFNDREVEVKDGQNLIAAAASAGVVIPHYCYHPGLPIDGNCRMCLVEVEGLRGLQIACNTFAKDGMVVKTDSPAVVQQRQLTQEFLLHNHPIDCPICDQAGECRLQDYYMEYGRYDNRSPLPKIEKRKVVDIGPLVVLDQERCILCSRCVRFCNEVTRSGELTISQRGDRSRIEIFPGFELDNRYSANTVDVCPVGALTSKDFRFKQRVWFLTPTKTVCAGCSRGCNIFADHRDSHVYRYRPRPNLEVNQHWMCDEGRLSYKATNDDRLRFVHMNGRQANFGEAFEAFVKELKKVVEIHGARSVVALASPRLSLEDAFVIRQLADAIGADQVLGACWTPEGEGDDFLVTSDRTPDRAGLALLGIDLDQQKALARLKQGGVQAILLVENDVLAEAPAEVVDLVKAVPLLAAFSSHRTATALAARYAFPLATHLESNGSFVNIQGRVQRFLKCFDAGDDAVTAWELFACLAEALGKPLGFAPDVEEVWTALKAAVPALSPVRSFYDLGDGGYQIPELAAERTPGQERAYRLATVGK